MQLRIRKRRRIQRSPHQDSLDWKPCYHCSWLPSMRGNWRWMMLSLVSIPILRGFSICLTSPILMSRYVESKISKLKLTSGLTMMSLTAMTLAWSFLWRLHANTRKTVMLDSFLLCKIWWYKPNFLYWTDWHGSGMEGEWGKLYVQIQMDTICGSDDEGMRLPCGSSWGSSLCWWPSLGSSRLRHGCSWVSAFPPGNTLFGRLI